MSAPVKTGDVLAGKYRVERVLGVGGMGVVVAATHLRLEQLVAIKFLLESALASEEVVARFAREARSASRIQSEHVARVIDVGELETGVPYMVMEYLEGKDLSEVLELETRLTIPRAVDYVLEACEALAEAHAAGIVHRDLKPSNLFLANRADGGAIIKVLDFGISKAAAEAGMATARLTGTAVIMGSPLYMSPEQLRSSRDVDARTDVWSLGIILYELIGGQPPYLGDSVTEIIANIMTEEAPELSTLVEGVPEELIAVLARCLQKKRDQRYANIFELADSLAPFGTPAAHASAEVVRRVLKAPVSVREPSASHPSVPERAAKATVGSDTKEPVAVGARTTLVSDPEPRVPIAEAPLVAPAQKSVYLPIALGAAALVVGVTAIALSRGPAGSTNAARGAAADPSGAAFVASASAPPVPATVAPSATSPTVSPVPIASETTSASTAVAARPPGKSGPLVPPRAGASAVGVAPPPATTPPAATAPPITPPTTPPPARTSPLDKLDKVQLREAEGGVERLFPSMATSSSPLPRGIHAGARSVALLVALSLVAGSSMAQSAAAPPGPSAAAPDAPPPPPPPVATGPKPLAESLAGEAKAEYEAGRLAFQAGDYPTATVKFAAAHELSHDPRLLFNLAVCSRKLNKWSKVLGYIERYKKDGGVLLSDADRKDADELIAAVRSFVSPLRLTVDPPGTRVFIDDEEVGVSPFTAPVLVDAGQRRIRATKKGFQDFQRVEDVPGAKEIAAALTLKPAQGRLLVSASPQDTIAVDGTVVGVGRWEGDVPSGSHTVRVTASGKRPYSAELVVKDEELRRIDATLASEQLAPTWAYIGGGVLVVAGLVGGGYLLLRDDKKETKPPVQGSLGTFSLPLFRLFASPSGPARRSMAMPSFTRAPLHGLDVSDEESREATRVLALLETGYLVVRADGIVDPAEYENLLVNWREWVQHDVAPAELDEIVADLEEAAEREGLFGRLVALREALDPDARRTAFAFAAALAVCDGSLDERESEVLVQVAAAFELSDEEVEATLSSVEDALAEGPQKPV